MMHRDSIALPPYVSRPVRTGRWFVVLRSPRQEGSGVDRATEAECKQNLDPAFLERLSSTETSLLNTQGLPCTGKWLHCHFVALGHHLQGSLEWIPASRLRRLRFSTPPLFGPQDVGVALRLGSRAVELDSALDHDIPVGVPGQYVGVEQSMQ